MNALRAYNQYRDQQVLTAGPGELILMLYDGAIRQIRLACASIIEKKNSEASKALIKAQEILDALIDGLDLEYELSEPLLELYDYFNRELVASNIGKDSDRAQAVEEMLVDLREVWEQVVISQRSQNRVAGE